MNISHTRKECCWIPSWVCTYTLIVHPFLSVHLRSCPFIQSGSQWFIFHLSYPPPKKNGVPLRGSIPLLCTRLVNSLQLMARKLLQAHVYVTPFAVIDEFVLKILYHDPLAFETVQHTKGSSPIWYYCMHI